MEDALEGVKRLHALEVRAGMLLGNALHLADHARGLAEQDLDVHVDRRVAEMRVLKHELSVASRDADERDRAALAAAEFLEEEPRLGPERENIALLGLAAPDLHRVHRHLFVVDLAQLELAASRLDELGAAVRKPACADVVDRHDRVGLSEIGARVDHALAAALHLGVSALDGVEVESFGVGARHHRGRCASAEAYAHRGASDLDDERADLYRLLLHLAVAYYAHAAREHYRLVVAAKLARDLALVGPEKAAELRTAELVAERRAANRPVDHYLERRRKARREGRELALPGLREAGNPEVGHHEAADAGDGARALARRRLVADFAADAGSSAGERRDRRRVVVGLDLHQLVESVLLEAVFVRLGVDREDIGPEARHDCGVVLVRAQGVLRTLLVRVLDHLEERLRLLLAVDDEFRAEDLVAAVLGVDLAEHHELGVGRVASGGGEALGEVLHLWLGDRKADLLVRLAYRLDALRHHVVSAPGPGLCYVEEIGEVVVDAFGHLVVESREPFRAREGLLEVLLRDGGPRVRERDVVANSALDALYRLEPAVAEDVGRLGAPRADRALPGRHVEIGSVAVALRVEERRRAFKLGDVERLVSEFKRIHPPCVDVQWTKRGVDFRDCFLYRIQPERRIRLRTEQQNHLKSILSKMEPGIGFEPMRPCGS